MNQGVVNPVKLGFVYAKTWLLPVLREPVIILVYLGFPVLIFSFVMMANPHVAQAPIPYIAMWSFLGLVLNSTGSITSEVTQVKQTEWGKFMLALPGNWLSRFIGHGLSAGALSLLSPLLVIFVGIGITSVKVTGIQWLWLFLTLLLGCLPFMLIGYVIGVVIPWRMANLISFLLPVFLLMLSTSNGLPGWLHNISLLLPSQWLFDILNWTVGGSDDFSLTRALVTIAVWLVLLVLVAMYTNAKRQVREKR